MSKKKNKKKAVVQKPKKKSKKRLIITSIAVAVIVVCIAAAVIVSNLLQPIDRAQLCDTPWTPVSASDASGDEVEMSEVYGVNYSSYTGSLTFKDDGTFSLWLTPGNPDDGTHSGSYYIADESTITVTFDEGTSTDFQVVQKDGTISSVIVNYDDYEVVFTR